MSDRSLAPLADVFCAKLFDAPSGDLSFNPYRDFDPDLDREGAVEIRRRNLIGYVERYASRPEVLLVAEAPGPWGCRFSGVPITSEAQLVDPAFPLEGAPSGRQERPHHEYSARIYWRVLGPFFPRFFTWNTFPFHPFRPGNPLSIRTPTTKEVHQFADVLEDVIRITAPRHILAVGRKAESALNRIGASCTYVRHPSQGGATLFEQAVSEVMGAL
jgi:hypothetical protein